jgi:hypothetical protein
MEASSDKKFSAMKITKYWNNQAAHDSSDNYIDPLFPHQKSSLYAQDSQGNFLNASYQKKAQDINPSVAWKSAREIFDHDFLVFKDKIEPADLKQKSLGDCYFVSALAALAEFPNLLHQIFRTKKVSQNGYYEIVLFLDGEWQVVTLDDYFVVKNGTDDFEFSTPNGNEIWVPLLEKAWAKINGGYAAIISGWPCDPMRVITGFPSLIIQHQKQDQQVIWDTLLHSELNKKIMATVTKNEEEIRKFGLAPCHAYTLVGVHEVFYNDKTLRLVKIRNPWGRGEWTGDWSDKSDLWNDDLKSLVGYHDSDDGNFYMSFEDFLKMFNRTDVCNIMYNSNFKTFEINGHDVHQPQVYNLLLEEDSEICISLHRPNDFYNHNTNQTPCPLSIAVARCDEENNLLLDVVGGNETYLDVDFVKTLKKGLYVIWVYCSHKLSHNKPESLKLRLISQSQFRVKHETSDPDFKIIKEILESGIKQDNKEQIDSNKSFSKIENCYKSTGLGYIYFLNKYDNYSLTVNYDSTNIKNIPLFKPYDDETKFSIVIPPMKSALVFGLRSEPYCHFNCDSNAKFGPPTDDVLNETTDLSSFVSLSSILNEQIGEDYYEYSYLNVETATQDMNFESMSLVASQMKEKLTKQYPLIMSEIEKLDPAPNEEDLEWTSKKLGGCIYIGQLDKNQKKNGRGAYYWQASELICVAYFENGQRQRYGKILNSSGKVLYQGSFNNDKQHGQGEYFYTNGNYYQGEFANDKANGQGTYSWTTGAKWHGNFVNGNMTGVGKYYPVKGNPYDYEFKK